VTLEQLQTHPNDFYLVYFLAQNSKAFGRV
jgi:hypothetical protein